MPIRQPTPSLTAAACHIASCGFASVLAVTHGPAYLALIPLATSPHAAEMTKMVRYWFKAQ